MNGLQYCSDHQGRTIRKSDNRMRTEHQLPLLAGKYTWRNSKLLGFPHKNVHPAQIECNEETI